MKRFLLSQLFILALFSTTYSQLKWTGGASNNQFFDEGNWVNSAGNVPAQGTINPDQNINQNLEITDVTTKISSTGNAFLGTGTLTITNATVELDRVDGGKVVIQDRGYLDLNGTDPLTNAVVIDLISGVGWVRTLNKSTSSINTNNLSQLKVSGVTGTYGTTLRIDNYYDKGAVIRSNSATADPLTIYPKASLSGYATKIEINTQHKGRTMPGGMDNKMMSFVLRKGFMVTFAVNENGTGKSKTYIASLADLTVNNLPSYLQNNVSYIRVLPWNWVLKKGVGGNATGLKQAWYYNWGNGSTSDIEREYAPMAWGYGGIDTDSDVAIYVGKYKATHAMAFNESDDCSAQSGQYNNLCDTDVASGIYPNLMKTGMRLVSPSCREEAPFGWLSTFYDKVGVLNGRVDVIGVHWYDWGSSPASTPNASATDIFNRFKTYLTNVYNKYGLPIWVTEFNANPNRSNATNLAFMQLALPYLEGLDYVERYAWFEPNSDVADYYDAGGNITNVGTYYRDYQSTPSIPETTWSGDSNLDKLYGAGTTTGLLLNGDFEKGNLDNWQGYNNAVVTTPVYAGTSAGRVNATTDGSLLRVESVEVGRKYTFSCYGRWNTTPSSTFSIRVLNNADNAVITTKEVPATTAYQLIEVSFTVPIGVDKVKIQAYKAAGLPAWFMDNAKLSISQGGTLVKWTGSVSTAWSNASNWDAGFVPNGSHNVLIPNLTNDPVINSTSETVNHLELEDGVVLTLNGTGNLTVLEDLTATTGYVDLTFGAALIVKGTATGSNHRFTRATTFDVGTSRYSVIGSPITSATTASLGSIVYKYNEQVAYGADGNGRFSLVNGVSMTPGDAFFSAKTGTITFTGTPNSGNVTQSLVYTTAEGGNAGYNLVSNPYTAALDFGKFMTENKSKLASETIYIWDDGGSQISQRTNSDYIVINSLGATRVSANGRQAGWDGAIRSIQGFFVKANQSGQLTFTPDMLVTGKNDAAGFYRKQSESDNILRIALTDSESYSDILVGLREDATLGIDASYDAPRIPSGTSLKLAALQNGEPFAIAGVPFLDEDIVMNLDVHTNQLGALVLTLVEGELENYTPFLEDRAMGLSVNLNEGAYAFSALESGSVPRFQLILRPNTVLRSPKVKPEQVFNLFMSQGFLHLSLVGTQHEADVFVFDLGGRLVNSYEAFPLIHGKGQAPFSQKGLFIVKVVIEGKVYMQKVIAN